MLTSTTFSGDSRPPAGLALPPAGIYVPGHIWQAGRSAQPFEEGRRHRGPMRPAQKAGLRYQGRVERELRRRYGDAVELGPWFRYVDEGVRPRWCQPDAILLAPVPIAIEVKLRWMDTAWWQLQRLYLPVLAACFGVTFRAVSIVRSFDPAVAVPVAPRLIDELDTPLASGEVGVAIWR